MSVYAYGPLLSNHRCQEGKSCWKDASVVLLKAMIIALNNDKRLLFTIADAVARS